LIIDLNREGGGSNPLTRADDSNPFGAQSIIAQALSALKRLMSL
jgi:hypothetical protein